MRTKSKIELALGALVMACNLQAQHTLDWFTIDGGGGTYTLDGTVGQAASVASGRAILGKAMTGFKESKGMVLVLVTLQ